MYTYAPSPYNAHTVIRLGWPFDRSRAPTTTTTKKTFVRLNDPTPHVCVGVCMHVCVHISRPAKDLYNNIMYDDNIITVVWGIVLHIALLQQRV